MQDGRQISPSTLHLRFVWTLTAHANVRQVPDKPKYLEKPKHHNNYHNAIQDGLDGGLHRYKAVDEPK
jgi:hypothetical protein